MEHIKYLRKKLQCGTYRYGQNNDIAFSYAVFKGQHLTDQTDLLCCGCIYRISLNADHLISKASAFEVDGHRASYKSQSYYSNLHTVRRVKYMLKHCHSTGYIQHLLYAFRCLKQDFRFGAERYADIVLAVLSEDEARSNENSCFV